MTSSGRGFGCTFRPVMPVVVFSTWKTGRVRRNIVFATRFSARRAEGVVVVVAEANVGMDGFGNRRADEDF